MDYLSQDISLILTSEAGSSFLNPKVGGRSPKATNSGNSALAHSDYEIHNYSS